MRLSLTISFTFAFLLGGSSGSAIVSIFLSSYKNPGGRDDYGSYCDVFDLCDHYFIVCLDKVSGSSTDIDQCKFGRYRTGTIFNKNKIHFQFEHTIGNIPNPKELHFHRWPERVLLKVQVWDYDRYGKDGFVELLTRAVSVKASRSRAVMRYKLLTVQKRTRLHFKVAVFCNENWYGPHCDIYCNPSLGNYRCEPDGRKVCHPGLACDDEIDDYDTYDNEIDDNETDDCASNPCANGGSCFDRNGPYQCHCPYGYTGSTCAVVLSECASNPCDNNATCVDEIGQFRCHCPIGYEGYTCETHTDAGSCTSCDSEVKGSHTSQTAKVSGITVTVVVIIVFAFVTLLIIWKIKQKRQAQQNEQQNGDHRLSHEESSVYYIAEPVHQQHLMEENIYQNSTGGDTQRTDAVLYGNSAYGTCPENVYGNASVIHLHETQADAENDTSIIDNPVYNTGAANMHASTQSNTRGNALSGGEVDTVEYTNAICVKNTGDVYSVMNK